MTPDTDIPMLVASRLRRVVAALLRDYSDGEQVIICLMCWDAISAAIDGVGTHVGRTASSAVYLLLEPTLPDREDAVRALAALCERQAMVLAESAKG